MAVVKDNLQCYKQTREGMGNQEIQKQSYPRGNLESHVHIQGKTYAQKTFEKALVSFHFRLIPWHSASLTN